MVMQDFKVEATDHQREHGRKMHRSRRKLKDMERNYNCNVLGCSRPYASEQSLKQHKKRKHSFFGLEENEVSFGTKRNLNYKIEVKPSKCLLRKRTVSYSVVEPTVEVGFFGSQEQASAASVGTTDADCSTDSNTCFPFTGFDEGPSAPDIQPVPGYFQPQSIDLQSICPTNFSLNKTPPLSANSCTSSSPADSADSDVDHRFAPSQENYIGGSASSIISRSNSHDSMPGIPPTEQYRKLVAIMHDIDRRKSQMRGKVCSSLLQHSTADKSNLELRREQSVSEQAEFNTLATIDTLPETTLKHQETITHSVCAKNEDISEYTLDAEFSTSLKIKTEPPQLLPRPNLKRLSTNELEQEPHPSLRDSQAKEQLERASRCLQRELQQQQQLIQALLRHQQIQINQQLLLHQNLDLQENDIFPDTNNTINVGEGRQQIQPLFSALRPTAVDKKILSTQNSEAGTKDGDMPMTPYNTKALASSLGSKLAADADAEIGLETGSNLRQQASTNESSLASVFDVEDLMSCASDINLMDSVQLADNFQLYDNGFGLVKCSSTNEHNSLLDSQICRTLKSKDGSSPSVSLFRSNSPSQPAVTMKCNTTAPSLAVRNVKTTSQNIAGLWSPVARKDSDGSSHLAMLDRCLSFVSDDKNQVETHFNYSDFLGIESG
ncbi:hypothetical protein SARC_04264 [Sphaeroforma arctica JP610]|uniref:C2H2-type domain-containing protein n=1 Tax=Sphaeroforma arctica JP610 TaxID=667725 RepID=A0A0L0G5E9_9EUKA|nr:hypothetical protein SARC_04264 [Sphaeroforma arctica JP610]KNC83483.1 hypothetical protein SARC_04264 [Sphaeroforma arctica JP610]|eukprot:XP_014157385.1 hypothetical protein SARC_04264 [Sphaeroforma arctica JP610]